MLLENRIEGVSNFHFARWRQLPSPSLSLKYLSRICLLAPSLSLSSARSGAGRPHPLPSKRLFSRRLATLHRPSPAFCLGRICCQIRRPVIRCQICLRKVLPPPSLARSSPCRRRFTGVLLRRNRRPLSTCLPLAHRRSSRSLSAASLSAIGHSPPAILHQCRLLMGETTEAPDDGRRSTEKFQICTGREISERERERSSCEIHLNFSLFSFLPA